MASLFSGLFKGFVDKMSESNLASGMQFDIQGEDQTLMVNCADLNASVSPEEVYQAAQRAGETEASALLLADQSKYLLATAQNSLKNIGTRLNHAGSLMQIENQYRIMQAKHGKNVVRYHHNNMKNQSQYNGFTSAFDAMDKLDL